MAEKRPLIAQIQRSLSKIEMAATPAPSIDKTEKQTLSKQRNAHSDGLGRVLFLKKSLFIRRLHLQFLESHNEWRPTIL